MQHFPIGQALVVCWSFKKPDGSVFDISGHTARLFCISPRGESEASGVVIAQGGNLTWTFPANKQSFTGNYHLRLILAAAGSAPIVITYRNAFALYSGSCAQSNTEEQNGGGENMVDLITCAEYYRFQPIVPTIGGNDSHWIVNGVDTGKRAFWPIIIDQDGTIIIKTDGEDIVNTSIKTAIDNASAATTAASEAAAGAEAITQAATIAEESRVIAEAARVAQANSDHNRATSDHSTSAQAVAAANEAAAKAESAAEHSPYIRSTDKHWMVWDGINGTYVDTGIAAEGSNIDIRQATGTSMTAVMSQKAVTVELDKKQNRLIAGANITIAPDGKTISAGGEPEAYIKAASVADNALTLTKKDGTQVVFSPERETLFITTQTPRNEWYPYIGHKNIILLHADTALPLMTISTADNIFIFTAIKAEYDELGQRYYVLYSLTWSDGWGSPTTQTFAKQPYLFTGVADTVQIDNVWNANQPIIDAASGAMALSYDASAHTLTFLNGMQIEQYVGDEMDPEAEWVKTVTPLAALSDITAHNVATDAHASKFSDVNERIDNISTIGRFLALWDCVSGYPATIPDENPYPYRSGDYFIVSRMVYTPFNSVKCNTGDTYAPTKEVVSNSRSESMRRYARIDGTSSDYDDKYFPADDNPGLDDKLLANMDDTTSNITVTETKSSYNYKPSGSEFIRGIKSTSAETNYDVNWNDMYVYDGSEWRLLFTSNRMQASSKLFIAEYGVTTFSDIQAAILAGKYVVVYKSGSPEIWYSLCSDNMDMGDASEYYFSTTHKNAFISQHLITEIVTISYGDTWSRETFVPQKREVSEWTDLPLLNNFKFTADGHLRYKVVNGICYISGYHIDCRSVAKNATVQMFNIPNAIRPYHPTVFNLVNVLSSAQDNTEGPLTAQITLNPVNGIASVFNVAGIKSDGAARLRYGVGDLTYLAFNISYPVAD